MTDFYQRQAKIYFQATASLDSTSILQPLADRLEPGSRILDVGCGSGRDLLWFRQRGYKAAGVERAPALAALARNHSGCPVATADFMDHDFGQEAAEALMLLGALVHLGPDSVGPALSRMLPALHGSGLLLLSLKAGHGRSRAGDGRIFTLWRDADARQLFKSLDLSVLEASLQQSPLRAGDMWLSYVLSHCTG